ncbi:DUF4360 domain-containing protein [Actinoplanes sp. CA-030573]|uniref:DUF4360 domain-containing protein n=1 Tax=Actinoplanes sp. CA-030573 TaxID=3239898 RepID=UPI003D90DD55
MLRSASLVATMLASLAAPATAAYAAPATPPPPDKMVIGVVGANGSGCPAGTYTVQVAPDNTAFTVTYSRYTAQVGVGAGPLDFRRNCQIALNVHVPSGFTFAIAEADYRGYAHLEAGSLGYEAAGYYFQGQAQTTHIQHNLSSPRDGDWQTTDLVGVASLSFLPCGEYRYLNINTELRVYAGTSDVHHTTSLLTMDSTDSSITTIYHIAWRRC